MLKYKVLSENQGRFTWKVFIAGKRHPSVGNFIQEIKNAQISAPTGIVPIKVVYIYRKGIKVGTCSFKGEEAIEWIGNAREIWSAPVERCEMSYHNIDPIFRIWIKEPREGAYVYTHPILPWLREAISMPIPMEVRK